MAEDGTRLEVETGKAEKRERGRHVEGGFPAAPGSLPWWSWGAWTKLATSSTTGTPGT